MTQVGSDSGIQLTTDARALFERSAVKIPAEHARPLWDAWARYEYMYGDLAGVHKLEARFAEVFPNGTARFGEADPRLPVEKICAEVHL